MSQCKHNHNHDKCQISSKTSNLHQTLDELDFERGIWYAAQTGDLDRVVKLLHKGHDVNCRDSAGYSALHYAVRSGHVELCKFLLDRNADVNAITKAGCATALHRACTAGKIDIVKLLLFYKANVSLKDSDGKTALHRAAEKAHEEICKILIDVNPKLKEVSDDKDKIPVDYVTFDNLASILRN